MESERLDKTTARSESLLVLSAGRSSALLWKDLWRFRELLAFLAWRDVLLRYKQAAFGIGWALLRPVLTMLVFTLIFRRVVEVEASSVPYPLFALCGMLVWQFFSGCVADAAQSLVSNTSLVTKVFFPRLILPASTTLVNLLDFAVTLALFAGLWLFYGTPSLGPLWALPGVLLWMLGLALGVGFWLSSATVRYRDVKFLVPFGLQLGLYASPIGYPISALPEKFRFWAYLNPLSGLVEGFRWCFFGSSPADAHGVWLSLGVSVFLLLSGFVFFRKMEDSFADII